ncbi:MAG: hypothetical protein QT02_C0004G0022 [archaeon GW2011_AR9]|nr:MAG: hypothetical protein QT02_C0004G0022 [archaeon GW2011_AR9]MBS3120409.1 hypothetical protein [Candidatus Woesearchaeota archaeon]HIH13410.1 hypothetical protein [Candidatus Woesearchaeota archaeon]
MEHTPHHTKSEWFTHFAAVIGIVIIFLAVYNLWQTYGLSAAVNQQTVAAAEAAIPAKIQVALITAADCKECLSLTPLLEQIKAMDINLTAIVTEEYNRPTGKALIEKYQISHVPTILLKGELDKSAPLQALINEQGQASADAVILSSPEPPFVEVSSGKVRQKVGLTVLRKNSCEKCYDVAPLVEKLKEQLNIEKYKEVFIESAEGKELVSQYAVTVVPTLIFDQEAELYSALTLVWKDIGTVESDGSYVMRNLNPPYYNITEGRVRGLVTLTALEDKNCLQCYRALTVNKPILLRLGLVLGQEKSIDISTAEAQGLIAKYNLSKIPTIIVTGDTEVYPYLAQIWAGVGTIEKDQAYVLRKVELFGQPYKDLESNQVITPAPEPSAAS